MTPAGRFTAYKWVCGLSAAALQSLIYFGIGHAHITRSTELLRTRFDDAIPFIAVTAWFYLPVYAAIFIIAIAGLRTRTYFNRALAGVLIILAVGLVGHSLVRAEYPRPVVAPPYHGISELFMAWVQAVDPPGNVFPSLHVAHTSSLALIIFAENRRLGRVVIVMAALLALSTLTTKQHFIADVISGFALAAITRIVVLRGVSATPAPAKEVTA